jgi:hypothetical protein
MRSRRGMRLGRLLRLLWTVLLLARCWPLPAQQVEATSPEPSPPSLTVPLQTCLDELDKQLQTDKAELERQNSEWTQRTLKLSSDFAEQLRVAVNQAAAEAVKPLVIELAGVRTESKVYQSRVMRWQVATGVSIGVAIGFAALAVWLAVR